MPEELFRLDRIEALLQAQAEAALEFRRDLGELGSSIGELRNTAELHSQQIANLVNVTTSVVGAVEAMQDDIQTLAIAMRLHRSDGHGGA